MGWIPTTWFECLRDAQGARFYRKMARLTRRWHTPDKRRSDKSKRSHRRHFATPNIFSLDGKDTCDRFGSWDLHDGILKNAGSTFRSCGCKSGRVSFCHEFLFVFQKIRWDLALTSRMMEGIALLQTTFPNHCQKKKPIYCVLRQI